MGMASSFKEPLRRRGDDKELYYLGKYLVICCKCSAIPIFKCVEILMRQGGIHAATVLKLGRVSRRGVQCTGSRASVSD